MKAEGCACLRYLENSISNSGSPVKKTECFKSGTRNSNGRSYGSQQNLPMNSYWPKLRRDVVDF